MKLHFFLLFFPFFANAQKQLTVFPESWNTVFHWEDKFEFNTTEALPIGKIETIPFHIKFGNDYTNNKYYLLLTLEGGEEGWFFDGKIKLMTGKNKAVLCTDRDWNSNVLENTKRKITALYFLTAPEYKDIESSGIKSISFSLHNGQLKPYDFDGFLISFDQRDMRKREAEEAINIGQIRRDKADLDSIEYSKLDADIKAKMEAKDRFNNAFKGGMGKSQGSPGKQDFTQKPKVAYTGFKGVLKSNSNAYTTSKIGKIKFDVCVDNAGDVIKVSYNATDSTTEDIELIEFSRKQAWQYRFTIGEKKCGNMVFDFNDK